MSDSLPEWFVVRFRFWWLWLRLAVSFQLVVVFAVGILVLGRAAAGSPLFVRGEETGWLILSVAVTVVATAISLVYWLWKRYFLTVQGIHRRGQFGQTSVFPNIYWKSVTAVQVRRDWLGMKWLRIVPEYGEAISLPDRPADYVRFREAVERFAGPDHPLARVLDEIAGEG